MYITRDASGCYSYIVISVCITQDASGCHSYIVTFVCITRDASGCELFAFPVELLGKVANILCV